MKFYGISSQRLIMLRPDIIAFDKKINSVNSYILQYRIRIKYDTHRSWENEKNQDLSGDMKIFWITKMTILMITILLVICALGTTPQLLPK